MYTRRRILGAAAALSASGLTPAYAKDQCTIITPERQKATTPAAALKSLKDGNDRFVAGKMINCDLRQQVKATARGQYPIAAVVGCIDSRVPPEMVFDQYLGDIFAARIAGNFVNTDIIGSLEFSTKVAGAKVIVVLGHTGCGAIRGAIDNVKLGNLTAMLANIRPAVDKVATGRKEKDCTSTNREFVQAVAEKNTELAAQDLVEKSTVLRSMVDAGEVKIVRGMHDIGTGRVTFSE
ncbi:MAG: carbonic anhydrase [Hyphomicrobiaceae bacterium]|nr:carbonic anhydrase [Hyphomicrobiaceae bacterium]MCC0009474.1 carbonic anhydrase [Hyphomicrobiaceae bacterium]